MGLQRCRKWLFFGGGGGGGGEITLCLILAAVIMEILATKITSRPTRRKRQN